MSDAIRIEHLTIDQQRTFNAVLDMIIPEDRERNKPSAADIDVFAWIRDHAASYIDELKRELDAINAESTQVHRKTFHALEHPLKVRLLDVSRARSPRLFRELASWTVTAYYQDDRVMEAIGLPARPPFPLGYEIQSGDLSLLGPVRARGKLYRDA